MEYETELKIKPLDSLFEHELLVFDGSDEKLKKEFLRLSSQSDQDLNDLYKIKNLYNVEKEIK